MNPELLEFALEGLRNEVQKLRAEIKELKERIDESDENVVPATIVKMIDENELIDTKEVLKKLGICYNTLQTIIRKGLIKPIRVSKRRIRFTRKSIHNYILSLSGKMKLDNF